MCLSSNGKTVTWASNERGYRPNIWKRISIHIKKKEEVNQTAIIKPFSKDCDMLGDAGGKMANPGQQGAQCLPTGSYRPRTPSPLPTISQHASLRARKEEEEEEEAVAAAAAEEEERQDLLVPLPSYLSERPPAQHPPALHQPQQHQLQQHHHHPAPHALRHTPHLQHAGPAPQSSIMDQISCVVHRFTANISELNSMMLPGSSSVPGPSSAASGPAAAAGILGGLPSSPSPSFLIQHDLQLPATVTTYAEVVAVSNVNPHALGGAVGIGGSGLVGTGGRVSPTRLMGSSSTFRALPPAAAARPPELEELVALQPPSPFRDSSLGSASESSASLASQMAPAEQRSPSYDRLVLRHYSQSSSSL